MITRYQVQTGWEGKWYCYNRAEQTHASLPAAVKQAKELSKDRDTRVVKIRSREMLRYRAQGPEKKVAAFGIFLGGKDGAAIVPLKEAI